MKSFFKALIPLLSVIFSSLSRSLKVREFIFLLLSLLARRLFFKSHNLLGILLSLLPIPRFTISLWRFIPFCAESELHNLRAGLFSPIFLNLVESKTRGWSTFLAFHKLGALGESTLLVLGSRFRSENRTLAGFPKIGWIIYSGIPRREENFRLLSGLLSRFSILRPTEWTQSRKIRNWVMSYFRR